jgi:hypothetical protein
LEHPVCSIFPAYEDGTDRVFIGGEDGTDMLTFKLQMPVNHPIESTQQSPSLSSMVYYRVALNCVIHGVENTSSIYGSDPNILNPSHFIPTHL